MLGVALYFIAIIAVVRATTGTCANESTPKGAKGFGVRFYSYPYNSTAGWDPNFFTTGYRTTLLNSLTQVTAQNFLNSNGNIYGYNINSQNYTVELDAIIQAPVTGKYMFTIGANDGFSLQIGLNQTCCDDFQGSGFGDFRMDVLRPIGSLSDGLTTATATVSFTKDLWYPIKIIMFNAYGPDGLNVFAEIPGRSTSEIGTLISQTPFGQKCVFPVAPIFQSITKLWDETYSSTTTSLGMNGALTPVAFVPQKRTMMFTTTNPDGSVETDSGIVIVEKDSKGSFSTSVSLFRHTGIVGTTVLTTTNPDGSVETDSGVVIVEKDSKGSFSTSVSLFRHTGIVGTTVLTTTNPDGSVETDSGVVIVEKDSKGSLSTSVSLFPHTSAKGSSSGLPESSAQSSCSSSAYSLNPGGWNLSHFAPLTSKLIPSMSLTQSCTDQSLSVSSDSSGSSQDSTEPIVSLPRSSGPDKGSGSQAGTSSSVVTTTRTVVTTRTDASGLTEVVTTTITTTYCPFNSSKHADTAGPNGTKSEGGSATHTDSSDMSSFEDVSSKKSPRSVPNEETITTPSQKVSVTGSGIAMSDNSPVLSSRSAAELSAMVTSSPSSLSIAPDKTILPDSSAASSSFSSVSVYEAGVGGISPMMVMIVIPILSLVL